MVGGNRSLHPCRRAASRVAAPANVQTNPLGSDIPGLPPGTPAVGGANDMVPKMEFWNTDIKEVLEFYRKLANVQMIYDNTALQQGSQVNIIVNTPIPRDEAIKIIETTLLINGISLVQDGPNMIKAFGLGKQPQVAGVPIISDESEIPDRQVRSLPFSSSLQYADPTDVVQEVGQLVLQMGNQPYTQFLPLPRAGALLLTDSTPRLRGLLKIIREIDTEPAQVVSEFIQLERADAKDVLDKLKEPGEESAARASRAAWEFAGSARDQPVARQVAPQVQVNAEGAPIPPGVTATTTGSNSVEISAGSLSEEAIIVGKIRLSADTRTNRIYVVTRPVNMPFIRKLLTEFDKDVKFGEPTVRALQYVRAGDVLQTIVDAITEPGQKAEGGQGGQGGKGQNQQTNRNANNNANQNNNNSNFNNGGANGGNGTGGPQLAEELNTEEADNTPESKIIGNTKIIADKRNNTIIVLGNKEVKAKIFSLLDRLDRKSLGMAQCGSAAKLIGCEIDAERFAAVWSELFPP